MTENIQLTCGSRLRQHIQTNLKEFKLKPPKKNEAKRAAVAVTIVDLSQDPGFRGMTNPSGGPEAAALVLTLRAARLKSHPGQWALPGGRMDEGERPEETALRELSEEVGLRLDRDSVLGRLDDYTTRSGYRISPVVVWGGAGVTLRPNPSEVASIHRIPISEFMREDAPWLESIPQSPHPVLMMPVGNSWIGAPTAAMIYQFREVAILGRPTRVAHYEQPYFAWK